MVRIVNLMFLPEEDEVIDAEHVEGGHASHHRHPQSPTQAALVGSDEDLVLRPESGKGRNTGNRETADEEADARDGHELVQAVHLVVLIAVNGMDDGTGAQEEQRLEHSVGEQVEHRRHVAQAVTLVNLDERVVVGAHGQRGHHEGDLRDG